MALSASRVDGPEVEGAFTRVQKRARRAAVRTMGFRVFPSETEWRERRATRRRRVLLTGKIISRAGFTANCAVRNLSDTGAQVAMQQDQLCPTNFHLIVVRDGVARRARTVWTRYPLAGIAFEDSYELVSPSLGGAMSPPTSERQPT
jgi:hypothetical protein